MENSVRARKGEEKTREEGRKGKAKGDKKKEKGG